jgi:hypothetical protein
MRWLILLVIAGCTVGDGSGKARRWNPPEILPEGQTGPSWLVRVTELRTGLARAGIELVMRGEKPVMQSTTCAESKRRCTKCQLLGEQDMLPGGALDEIATAFARYPQQTLEASNIKYVALCTKLYTGGPIKSPAGLADQQGRVLFVSVGSMLEAGYLGIDSVSETVHHEVFHMLDRNEMIDDEWHGLNPTGFVYEARENQWTRPDGFANAYAATNSVEDRATIFQFLMSRPDELCKLAQDDQIVAAKTKLMWKRLGQITDLTFLRTSVPCAATLEP